MSRACMARIKLHQDIIIKIYMYTSIVQGMCLYKRNITNIYMQFLLFYLTHFIAVMAG